MTFDPFDDFEKRGYLRNYAGEKDREIVKSLEHRSFLAKLDDALRHIEKLETIDYGAVLQTHKALFESVYPWAGQDRAQTAPDRAVSKGSVLFAHPNDARGAVDYALRMGQDKATMAERPGEVMGYLAYGHPFLDGNGRTIMVVHTELAQRAGISVDWAATGKLDYLTALTKELDRPGKGHLDSYLKPFLGPAIGPERLARHVAGVSGLSGDPLGPNQVLGRFSDPALQARYQQQKEHRQQSEIQTAAASGTPDRAADRPLSRAIKRDFSIREIGDAKHERDTNHTNDKGSRGRSR